MHSTSLFLVAFVALTLGCSAATESSPTPPIDPHYSPIAQLVGGPWRGKLPPGPSGARMKIELKADWAANHQGIHFDGTFIADGKRSPYTSGMYAWNPTMKQLVFLYTDNEGSLSEGSITNENGVIVHDFTVAEANGTISKIQARITFESSNVFTNEIFKSKEGKWEKFVSVRYERAP